MAAGSEVVEMVRGEGVLGTIVMLRVFAEPWGDGVEESLIVTVKVNVPVWVGVPEISPLEALRARPCGNCPAVMLQV